MVDDKKRAAWRAWYHRNKSKETIRRRLTRKRLRLKLTKEVGEYKELAGCQICKSRLPAVALDLHHIGNKENTVSNLVKSGCVEKARAELIKCVVVCANCHRLLHAGLVTLGN